MDKDAAKQPNPADQKLGQYSNQSAENTQKTNQDNSVKPDEDPKAPTIKPD